MYFKMEMKWQDDNIYMIHVIQVQNIHIWKKTVIGILVWYYLIA